VTRGVAIREAGRRDADPIAAMQAEAFPEDPWPALGIMTLMASPSTVALVAEESGAPAGFALFRTAADEAETITIGVRPAFRRRGVARALMAATIERAARRGARALFLEVAEDNPAGQALYASLGFSRVGRRPDYYRRNGGTVAALVMRIEIGPETIGPQSTLPDA
jgi:ribosomal-protein-alanine N-acetyltransferase